MVLWVYNTSFQNLFFTFDDLLEIFVAILIPFKNTLQQGLITNDNHPFHPLQSYIFTKKQQGKQNDQVKLNVL